MTTAFIISFVFNIFFVWALWKTLKRNKEYVERSISHTYIMANAEQELINLRAQNEELINQANLRASCEKPTADKSAATEYIPNMEDIPTLDQFRKNKSRNARKK